MPVMFTWFCTFCRTKTRTREKWAEKSCPNCLKKFGKGIPVMPLLSIQIRGIGLEKYEEEG